MKVILFGATGMVGQGVLRECLLDDDVERVLIVGRSSIGQKNDKVREIIHADLSDLSPVASELEGYDACFFCLGVSAAGMSEQEYRRITYDLTLSIANVLASKNPKMTFIYVSGSGTDSTERGRMMWARVKGATENALLKLPFAHAFMFRPAFIQPQHGVTSKTRLYNAIYVVMGPLYPILKALFPKYVTTSELVGRAMLIVAKKGATKSILENTDINQIASV